MPFIMVFSLCLNLLSMRNYFQFLLTLSILFYLLFGLKLRLRTLLFSYEILLAGLGFERLFELELIAFPGANSVSLCVR